MRHSYDFLLQALCTRIAHSPRCSTLEEAYETLRSSWVHVNQMHDSSQRMQDYLDTRRMLAEHGWQNLDGDPCRKPSEYEPGVWFNLHHNGSIVIERIPPEGRSTILFAHPGTGIRAPRGPLTLQALLEEAGRWAIRGETLHPVSWCRL